MHRLLIAVLLVLPAAAFGATDPVPYLPAETDIVMTVQVRQVVESELGQKYGRKLLKELLESSKQATVAVQATGLDPVRDLDVVTIGIGIDKNQPTRPFALLEGKFDRPAIDKNIAAFDKERPGILTAVTVAGKPAYRVAGSKPTDTMFAAFVDDTRLVVAATEKDLAGAFAAAAGGRTPVVSKGLAGLLRGVKPTAAVFVWGWVKGKFADLNLPNDKLKTAIQGVDWAAAAIQITRDVAVTATVNTPDAAAAQRLADLLNGVVGLVRLQMLAAAEDQPELRPVSDLLRATKVVPNGRTVVIHGTVKGASIDKAMATPPVPKKAGPKKK